MQALDASERIARRVGKCSKTDSKSQGTHDVHPSIEFGVHVAPFDRVRNGKRSALQQSRGHRSSQTDGALILEALAACRRMKVMKTKDLAIDVNVCW
jgi:hypothetical protein